MLKLKAKDADDLQVISAVLQDSIVPVCDITFNQSDKNFVMVTQRLCREDKNASPMERICCAFNLRGVESVQTQGINLQQQSRMLDLLAVMFEGKTLTLVFAGDAKIRLQLGDFSLFVEDFGEPWPAQCNPCHEEARG